MFTRDVLAIDAAQVAREIEHSIRAQVLGGLRRRGAVLGLSGGVDSSVVAALSVRALGEDKVLGLFMPDRDSSPESLALGRALTKQLGIESILEDMTPQLAAAGCYERQEQAIREVFPEYGAGYKCKITLPSILESDRMNVSLLTIQQPSGHTQMARLPLQAYLKLVAATNYKQRLRKATEYYHADRLRYAVVGTPNRLEYDQGFFVKGGDGLADVKPIAHLYKTQVYALAEHLGVPLEIRRRPPTTETYSMPQGQDEFYFALPYDKMDLCLYAKNHGVPATDVGPAVELSATQVERIFKDIDAKRSATRYLHTPPMLVREVVGPSPAQAQPLVAEVQG